MVDWSTCSDIVSWNPLDVNADTTKLYSDIYHKVTNQRKNGERSKDFRMLIFSGDADGVCSTIGTQHWIYSVTEKERNTASSVLDELVPATATSASTHSSLFSPQSLPSPSSSSYFSSSQNRDSKSTTSSPISLWQPWVIVNGDSDIILETGAVRGRPQGGYLTQFEGSFSFATVHHAGHEVPGFQPIAALSLLSGFLDGSIFLSTTTTTSSSLGVGGSGTFFRPSDVWTSILITLGISGLMIVCCFMYMRETKLRLGSSGPPVSMIESEIDMSEDEGRVGPAARVSASPRIIFSPGSKYVPMSTDDD